ncbi:MAG TPA: 6-bladed beta-propeller [Gaiellaceae bacterium]|nr:6-bladed beta-propeller [Gaiellaceae bacterium]
MRDPRLITAAAALVVAAALASGAAAGSQGPGANSYKQAGKWGTSGAGNGQFRNPFGIATDRAGAVYVADTDNNRVQVFSASGAFQRKWGSTGSADGQFLSAQDVAVDAQGGVWVADYRNDRVQRFSAGGAFQQSLPASQPTGVAVDADGNLYVLELSGRVTRYDKASGYAAGRSFKAAGKGGDLEVDAAGNILAADPGGLKVTRYDSEGRARGTMRGGLSAPIGIGVDLDCNAWITQIAARRVAKFSASGKVLATVDSAGAIPEDVAFGRKGDLYLLGQGEVIRFAEDRSKSATASIPGAIKVSGGVARIPYTLGGVACPAEVGATATVTGSGISGKAAGLKLKAGARNVIEMRFSKAGPGKAIFKIVLQTNGRPTIETRSVTVSGR